MFGLHIRLKVFVNDPKPPACAMAMASFDSVTVSMAAEMMGMESSMFASDARGGRDFRWQHGRSARLSSARHQKVKYSGIWRDAMGQPFWCFGIR